MSTAKKILIIEDDETLRNSLIDCLSKEGYDVSGASNSQEAIDVAGQNQFDMFIADERLPHGSDGIETIEKIRTDPEIKVIVITGFRDRDTAVRALRIHVNDFIYKPFELDEFIRLVKHVFGEDQDASE